MEGEKERVVCDYTPCVIVKLSCTSLIVTRINLEFLFMIFIVFAIYFLFYFIFVFIYLVGAIMGVECLSVIVK